MTYPTTTSRLAAEVRAQMARGRVTVADLSDKSGVSESTLKRRLSGLTDFSVGEVERIAAALDISPVDLLAPALSAREEAS